MWLFILSYVAVAVVSALAVAYLQHLVYQQLTKDWQGGKLTEHGVRRATRGNASAKPKHASVRN